MPAEPGQQQHADREEQTEELDPTRCRQRQLSDRRSVARCLTGSVGADADPELEAAAQHVAVHRADGGPAHPIDTGAVDGQRNLDPLLGGDLRLEPSAVRS